MRIIGNVDAPPLANADPSTAKDVFCIIECDSFRNVAAYEIADIVSACSQRLVTSHARIEFLEIEPKLITVLI
jgi:hypothetical protein